MPSSALKYQRSALELLWTCSIAIQSAVIPENFEHSCLRFRVGGHFATHPRGWQGVRLSMFVPNFYLLVLCSGLLSHCRPHRISIHILECPVTGFAPERPWKSPRALKNSLSHPKTVCVELGSSPSFCLLSCIDSGNMQYTVYPFHSESECLESLHGNRVLIGLICICCLFPASSKILFLSRQQPQDSWEFYSGPRFSCKGMLQEF